MHVNIQVKICGIRTLEDARAAVSAGADMLGLNFYMKSPRYLAPDAARAMVTALRAELGADCPLLIGLFVNEGVGRIEAIVHDISLDAVQLSGDEPPKVVRELGSIAYKALRPRDIADAEQMVDAYLPYAPVDPRFPALLVDAYNPHLYGGTGETASVEVAVAIAARTPRMMLAGGLTPENVTARAAACGAWGVDVASGVEVEGQPGVKDRAKMAAFVAAAKAKVD